MKNECDENKDGTLKEAQNSPLFLFHLLAIYKFSISTHFSLALLFHVILCVRHE